MRNISEKHFGKHLETFWEHLETFLRNISLLVVFPEEFIPHLFRIILFFRSAGISLFQNLL